MANIGFSIITRSDASWVKDVSRSQCQHCQANFTLIKRKHHCRSCGDIFCGSCCAKNDNGIRVCGLCVSVQDDDNNVVMNEAADVANKIAASTENENQEEVVVVKNEMVRASVANKTQEEVTKKTITGQAGAITAEKMALVVMAPELGKPFKLAGMRPDTYGSDVKQLIQEKLHVPSEHVRIACHRPGYESIWLGDDDKLLPLLDAINAGGTLKSKNSNKHVDCVLDITVSLRGGHFHHHGGPGFGGGHPFCCFLLPLLCILDLFCCCARPPPPPPPRMIVRKGYRAPVYYVNTGY